MLTDTELYSCAPAVLKQLRVLTSFTSEEKSREELAARELTVSGPAFETHSFKTRFLDASVCSIVSVEEAAQVRGAQVRKKHVWTGLEVRLLPWLLAEHANAV